MKMHIKQILLLFLIFGIQACTKGHEEELADNDIILTVKAFYYTTESPDSEKADVGAKVYVYYDIYTIDLIDYNYISDGKFIKNNHTIIPDQNHITDFEGIVRISPIYTDKKITVVVESNYYKNRLATSCFDNFKKSISSTNIFKP